MHANMQVRYLPQCTSAYQGGNIDVRWKCVFVDAAGGQWLGVLIGCHGYLILSGQVIVSWELIAVSRTTTPILFIVVITVGALSSILQGWKVIDMWRHAERVLGVFFTPLSGPTAKLL